MVLVATDSGERRVLNMYRGVLSIREKAHELDNGESTVVRRGAVQDQSVEYFHGRSECKLKAYTCDPIQRGLPQTQRGVCHASTRQPQWRELCLSRNIR